VDEHWFSPKNLNESQAKWRSTDPLSMHDENGGEISKVTRESIEERDYLVATLRHIICLTVRLGFVCISISSEAVVRRLRISGAGLVSYLWH